MFQNRNPLKRSPSIDEVSDASKPFLYVLGYGQTSKDFEHPLAKAFKGTEALELMRAEVDLKRFLSNLRYLTRGAANSLTTLSAAGLPGLSPALIWVAMSLIRGENAELPLHQPNFETLSDYGYRRDHDALLILRSLHDQIESPGYKNSSIRVIKPNEMPPHLKFPAGHPLPRIFYRCHALPHKREFFYPVSAYFSLLLDDKEAELVQLLTDLGATLIRVYDDHDPAQIGVHPERPPENRQVRALEFNGHRGFPYTAFDHTRYAWLHSEPTWQALVKARLNHGCRSTWVTLTNDVSNLLDTQLQGVQEIMHQLETLRSINIKHLQRFVLRRRQVQVQFVEAY